MGFVEGFALLAGIACVGGLLARLIYVVAASTATEQSADLQEVQDDFGLSMARWGYLHDQREGGAQ